MTRALPVRRADGRAAGDVGVHAQPRWLGAGRRCARSSRTSAGCSSAGPTRRRPQMPARSGATRRRSAKTGDAAADADAAGRRRRALRRTRSKATSRTSRASTSPTAPASLVHPAPWYIGVRRPPYFVEQKSGLEDRDRRRGARRHSRRRRAVTVTLTQMQWTSVRRAEGNGFYTWDTERKEVPAGSWTVTTGAEPVPLDIAAAERRLLHPRGDRARRGRALRGDARRRSTRSATATPRGRASITTASTSCPSARPTSPATPRGS